jgi:hypothetical protein
VRHAQLIVDTRNATRGLDGSKVVGLSGERNRARSLPELAVAGV